jgi:2C-methyl-D-erythritol 2,4-cyclodiphosphate synthase
MQRNLSAVLGAPVSVKACSNEGMGWIGRGEGVACVAVALIGASLALMYGASDWALYA